MNRFKARSFRILAAKTIAACWVVSLAGGLVCAQTLENALVWPQFVVGGGFDAELRISNSDPVRSWSGQIRLFDQQASPMSGVSIAVVQDSAGDGVGLGASALQSEQALEIPARGSVLLQFTSESPEFLIGFLVLTAENSSSTTSGSAAAAASEIPAELDPLVTDFAYNLRDGSGSVIDRIPIPPVVASQAFFTTVARRLGFDVGIALASLEATTLEVVLHRSGFDPVSAAPIPLLGQQAFFPDFPGLSGDVDAALLEIRSNGPLFVATSLDVVSPPLGAVVQIAGKSLKLASTGCQVLASGLTFQDPVPNSAGFALSKVVADESAVYWFEFDPNLGEAGGSLKRVARDGGLVSILAEGLRAVNDFLLDGDSLYWSEITQPSGFGAIKRVTKSGGNAVILADNVFFPAGITQDDSAIFWGEGIDGGAIRRVPKSGGSITDIGRGQGFGPTSLVLDGSFFYGTTGDRLGRIPVQGGVPEILAMTLQNARSVVTDDEFVYWVELADSGRIARVAKTGGAVTELVGGVSNVHNIVLDATSVFFASPPSGQGPSEPSVRKVSKEGGAVTTAAQCFGAAQLVAPIFVAHDSGFFFVSDNVQTAQSRIIRLSP